jgi:NAD(P)-dependent dehydrogenase (short-subunit alcohol dehydrogenase family)
MVDLRGKVAVVTGASRGVGKGIALGLGEAGATVYITGRTYDDDEATVPLAGTLQQTAAEVTHLGGRCTAVRCDHDDDAQVEAVFEQVVQEQGRLDLLVNNAWAGYEGYHQDIYFAPNHPFWEKPISYWDANLVGVRWAYVASLLAVRKMVSQASGLIVNISFGVPEAGNPAYGIAKTAVDRLSWELAHQLRPHHIAAVSLYPGLVRTEGVLKAAQYFDLSNSESPQFTGRAVAALAGDPLIMQKTGQALVVARLAQDYNFDDVDGKRPVPIT